MLNLDQTFTFKLVFSFIVLLLLLSFIVSYIVTQFSVGFYSLWLILVIFVSLFVGVLFYIWNKKERKISTDVEELTNYLQAINEKNYEAILKTKHFSEFLKMELLLKNIVKRLHKRDSKK